MRVIHHVQGSQAWLDWRLGGIGSSDAMVIAAAHGMVERKPWMRSLDDLFEEKMTGISKVIENPRMQRGKDGEAAARAAFEKKSGMVVSPLCAEMDSNPLIKASFDGISFDGVQFVEIKCPHETVHELALAGSIVDYYKPQVAHQGIVAWGEPSQWPADVIIHFASFVPETGDLAHVVVPASEMKAFAEVLYGHELAFLASLNSGVPPCGAEYAALSKRYLGIEAEIKALTAIKDQLRESMVAVAESKGLTSLDGNGVALDLREKTGVIDWNALCSHYSITDAEKEKYRKQGSTFWQIRVDLKRQDEESVQTATELKCTPNLVAVVAQSADSFWTQFAPPQSTRKRANRATTVSKAA